MKRLAFLIVATVALAWTASVHAAGQPDRSGMAISPGAGAAAMDGGRDIVLAVANPVDPPPTHAGSSLLGYAPAGNYGAGQRAAMLLADLQRHYAWRQVEGWPIKELDLYCIVLEPPAGVDRDELLKQLAHDNRVQLAEPLHEYSTYSTPHDARRYNDPYVDLQRGFVETEAARAQNYSQGASVGVAIVDTGVDTLHPDLRGRLRDVHDLVGGGAAAFNRDHHGTEVAGIIAAEPDNHQGIVGIAPEAMLSIYKACWYPSDPGSGARCNSFTLAKALAAVLDNRDARVVNLSLGGPADPLLSKLLIRLLDDDRIVIAAMPPDARLDGFPDGVPGVIVVRSSDRSPAHAGVVSAPGHDILTTQPDGGYDFSSGSSMAAAHVSGIAALLLSLMPSLDAESVRELLLRSSTVSGTTLQVNAAAAVAAVRTEHPAQ